MIKKIIPNGHSACILLTKRDLLELNADIGDTVNVSHSKGEMTIKKEIKDKSNNKNK